MFCWLLWLLFPRPVSESLIEASSHIFIDSLRIEVIAFSFKRASHTFSINSNPGGQKLQSSSDDHSMFYPFGHFLRLSSRRSD